jgi:hypothetical protein
MLASLALEATCQFRCFMPNDDLTGAARRFVKD